MANGRLIADKVITHLYFRPNGALAAWSRESLIKQKVGPAHLLHNELFTILREQTEW